MGNSEKSTAILCYLFSFIYFSLLHFRVLHTEQHDSVSCIYYYYYTTFRIACLRAYCSWSILRYLNTVLKHKTYVRTRVHIERYYVPSGRYGRFDFARHLAAEHLTLPGFRISGQPGKMQNVEHPY